MNEEKMIEVLARVEDEQALYKKGENAVGFDMAFWGQRNECGTTACLAGHVALMDGWHMAGTNRLTFTYEKDDVQRFAWAIGRESLGLTEDEANDLFYREGLDSVYVGVAEMMGVDEIVLRDKVTAQRRFVP